ncbi:sulfatase family protein [Paludisphaera mucosa]|uniref:sulfatase family protein n=1 Tax=Paludisphaera mucosa TaxID=3030827 RepID=UPI003F5E7CFD
MRTWIAAGLAAVSTAVAACADEARPNVLWIVVDDMSPNFGCYGETAIATPNVDRLAREGTRFSRAFVTAPVCSASRSALITGMYQTTIGAQNHRSGRGAETIRLPEGVDPIPALFRRHGYYTAIGSPQGGGKLGKTDYNFEWDPGLYDGADWSGRKPGQPFFMQVQLNGGKQRENENWLKTGRKRFGVTIPDVVKPPPYYPRDPVILEDWAAYLDAVRHTDRQVGEVLARLEREGILDRTVVLFLTDHGISHARGKQFLYDEGIHVPLVVRGPGIPSGAVRDDLVSHIDLAATSLALAGAPIPKAMQARDLFANGYAPRDAVFSARDRCDETVDHIRSVRTDRYKYIRNFLPDRPHLQPNRYKDAKAIVRRLRELHAEGKLDAHQERLLFAPTRPKEELYDLRADPDEIHNLAEDVAHRETLEALRKRLDDWIVETGDRGATPEAASMYDSDMKVYVDGQKAAEAEILRRNIAIMKGWAAEGK